MAGLDEVVTVQWLPMLYFHIEHVRYLFIPDTSCMVQGCFAGGRVRAVAGNEKSLHKAVYDAKGVGIEGLWSRELFLISV